MTFRSLLFTLALLSSTDLVRAAELQGKVSGVAGKDVRLTIEGDLLPQPGDPVKIRFEIPGGPMVDVGTWRVTSIEGESVLAALVEATGTPAIGQLASITSASPQPRAAKVFDHVVVRYDGRAFETLYQHQIADGRPIDIYFFKAIEAGTDASGNARYNRFVRDPAENQPGTATWWYCRWTSASGQWNYVESKVEGVTVSRVQVQPSAHEGATWKTTSTDATGDRKGQSFNSEMTMTTSNGVTRMTATDLYLEGRFRGDRYEFTTHRPDGAKVGDGFAVFSGNVFSGGWTAANGRVGTWEGRRNP